MAKSPLTAIERAAKASTVRNGSRILKRATPSKEFLHSRKWKRIRNILLFILGLELFLFSLNFRTGNNDFIPAETWTNLKAMFSLPFRSLFDSTFDAETVRESLPYYTETVARFKLSTIAFLSGVIICVGGTMFQTIFKNPIASPNMLGVSTGVSFGNILFILTYQASALSHYTTRYLYCYFSAAVLVFIAFFAGKLSGKRLGGFSVEGTIIAGMMISHIGGVFMQYFQIRLMEDETGLVEIYRTLASGDTLYQDDATVIVFLVLTTLTIIPMLFLRFRFNAVAFDDMEMKAMGINNGRLRAIGLILGSLMATVAIIHCGDVGFLCMVIPFMMRDRLQTEFGEVAYLSGMLGGFFSLLVRVIISIINAGGMVVPAGVITTLVLLPLFIFTLIRRGSVFA